MKQLDLQTIAIQAEEIFVFNNFEHWVNKAKSRIAGFPRADISHMGLDYFKKEAIKQLCLKLSENPELFEIIIRDSFVGPSFKNIDIRIKILPLK